MRILYVLTAPQMAVFLRGQVAHLGSCGFKVVICAPEKTPLLESISREEGARIVCVPIRREIAPWQDIVSFLKLGIAIRRESPDVTVTLGPKAGLLGGLASAAAGVRARVQTKWGLRMETTRGALRGILWLAEKASACSASLTLFDSASARARAVEMGIVSAKASKLVGNGSANGIDCARFARNGDNLRGGEAFRDEMGVPRGAPLVGFVGRIGKDKGLREMLEAWSTVAKERPDAHLVLVGGEECRTPDEHSWLAGLAAAPNVRLAGLRSEMERIFPALDILLLPSHREGFGVVVLEAAAAGVPTVAFDVTGVRDAVVNGKTGLLAEFPDTAELSRHILLYLANEPLRREHGEAARERASRDFSRDIVWKGYHQSYVGLLEADSGPGIPAWRECP